MINRQERLSYFATVQWCIMMYVQYTQLYITRQDLTDSAGKVCVHVNPTVMANIKVQTGNNYSRVKLSDMP